MLWWYCSKVNWIGTIIILAFLRNIITIQLFVSVPLKLHWSLKNAIMYTCRDLWPTCRCIQLVCTFIWTLLPPASPYMRRFDWIESIHPFPTASSLSRSNPSSSASEATARGGGGSDYCSRRRRPRLPRAPASTATTTAPSSPHLLSGDGIHSCQFKC